MNAHDADIARWERERIIEFLEIPAHCVTPRKRPPEMPILKKRMDRVRKRLFDGEAGGSNDNKDEDDDDNNNKDHDKVDKDDDKDVDDDKEDDDDDDDDC